MLVQQFLERSAERFPDKTALVYKDRRLSYAWLDQAADALARTLIRRGLNPGDRVVVCLPNGPDAAIAVFAVLKASGVFVPLHPSIKEHKLVYVVNNCRASALICADRQARIYARSPNELPTVHTVIQAGGHVGTPAEQQLLELDACLQDTGHGRPPCRSAEQDLACLIYTSGSTGDPKGVVCGHDNVAFASGSIIRYLENTAEDIVINLLPFSFDYGLYQLLMVFRFGGTLVLEPSFVYPARVVQSIERERVTGFPIVPTMLALLLQSHWRNEQLRSLRYISNTAAALAVNHIQTVRTRLPWVRFYSMYGLTECKRALYLPPEQIDHRPASVGIAIPGTEVWLEDEAGNRVGPEVPGELIIRGSHVMRGYWENPEATRAVYQERPQEGIRVLRSGDLFKTDEQGYLYFLSRKDDIIKCRGEKVSPREIEAVAYRIEGVTEAAAVGVPDPILGQKIKLFVASRDSSLTEQQVKRHCSEHLEDFMVPQIVEIRARLPKTDSGKIKKSSLR